MGKISRGEIERRVLYIAGDVAGESVDLSTDLGDEFDSLDEMKFVMALEDEFSMSISDRDVEDYFPKYDLMRSVTLEDGTGTKVPVKNVVDYIELRLASPVKRSPSSDYKWRDTRGAVRSILEGVRGKVEPTI